MKENLNISLWEGTGGTSNNLGDINFQFVMKEVDKTSLTPTSSIETVQANSAQFIHIALTLEAKPYTKFTKAFLKIKQVGTTSSELSVKMSSPDYFLGMNLSKTVYIKEENGSIYRYIDITDMIYDNIININNTMYFALLTTGVGSVSLYTNNSMANTPSLEVTYYTDYDFYKNQKYIEGSIGETNKYSVNIRNGKFEYTTDIATISGNFMPFSYGLSYNIVKKDTNVINGSINTNLPYGFKFNFQQYLYKESNDYIYIDASYKSHRFKQAIDASSNTPLTNLYYEEDGNYLILKVEENEFIIETNDKEKLLFNSSGYLKEIKSKYETTSSIKINYSTEDINLVDNIIDGDSNIVKVKYLKVGSKYYIFLLFNNNDDLTNYSLTDYIDSSIGYIIYSNNKLETVVDKYKKETTYTYTTNTNLLTSIRRCNEEVVVNYDSINVVKTLYKKDYYIYSDEELEIYEERVSPIIYYSLKYIGNKTKVSVYPYNMTSRIRIYEYIFNEAQECYVMYELINNQISNLMYYGKNNCFENSLKDTKDLVKYSDTYYEKIYENSQYKLTTYINDIKYNISNYVLVIKPIINSSVDINRDYYVTVKAYTVKNIYGDDSGLEQVLERKYKLSLTEETVIVCEGYNQIDDSKFISFEVFSDIDYNVIYNSIVTTGIEIVRKRLEIEKEEHIEHEIDEIKDNFVDTTKDIMKQLNSIYEIDSPLTSSEVLINNTTGVLSNIEKLSLTDVEANYHNHNTSSGSYNFWYNDGKKMISNVTNVKINEKDFENGYIKIDKYNGQTEQTNIMYYTYNNIQPRYLIVDTTTKNIMLNSTTCHHLRYTLQKDLEYELNETGESRFTVLSTETGLLWNSFNIKDLKNTSYESNQHEYEYSKSNNEYTVKETPITTYNKTNQSIYNHLTGIVRTKNLDGIINWNMDYIRNKPSRVYLNLDNQNLINYITYTGDDYVSSYTDNGILYEFTYGINHNLEQVLQDGRVIIENSYQYLTDRTIITSIYNGTDKYEYIYSKYDQLMMINRYTKDSDSNFTISHNLLTNYYTNLDIYSESLDTLTINDLIYGITPLSKLVRVKEQTNEYTLQSITTYTYDFYGNIVDATKVQNEVNLKIDYDNGIHFTPTTGVDGFCYNQLTYYQNDTPILCENKIEKISGVYYDSELEAVEKSQQTVLNYSRNKIVQDNSVGTPEVIYTKNHSSYSGKNVEFVYIQNNTERNWNIIKEYEYKRYPNMPNCITLPNKETMIRHLGLNSTNQRSEETFEYDYDSLERINKDVHKVNNNSMYEKYYTYDVLNRIVREDNLGFGKTYTYEYDIYGNIINKKEYNYTRDTNLSSPTKTYNYIYHTTSDENKNPHMLKEYDGNLITYDNQNRMISYTTTTNSKQFVWDNKNMVQYTCNGTTLTFLYDTNGIRTNKIIEGNNQTIEIKYITNGNKIIKEIRSNGIELTYLHFNNEIVGFIYNNDYYMFYKNITGDIVAILNNNNVVARYKYDSWGNHIVCNSNGTENTSSTFIGNINPIRYKTYYYDVETQLFYCNSRYYSPELCRWISPDSIEYLDPESINGLNLYCYCGNNPIMYADPSGHFTIAALLISVGLSLAFEFVGDLIDGNGIDHSLREYIGAGVSGLFGGLSGGLGAQIVFSVAGGIADSWISGELNGDNMGQVLFSIGVSTVLSSFAGHLGGKLASKLKGNSLAKLGRHEIKNSMKNMGLEFSLNKNGTSAKAITKFLNKGTSVWLGKIVGEYGMAGTVSGLYSLLPF